MHDGFDAAWRDCERLGSAFAYHLDQADFVALVQLFTEDGAFIRNGEPLAGRKAMLAAYAKRPQVTIMHLLSNFHMTTFDGDRATASSYCSVVMAAGISDEPLRFDPAAAVRLLEFKDEYVRTPEGWRISLRNARPVLQSINWPY
jgi:hypothetical protein